MRKTVAITNFVQILQVLQTTTNSAVATAANALILVHNNTHMHARCAHDTMPKRKDIQSIRTHNIAWPTVEIQKFITNAPLVALFENFDWISVTFTDK